MSEIDIVKIVIEVLVSMPLLMSLVLWIDYNMDGKYDIEYKVIEFEDIVNEYDYMIRFIEKVNDIINKGGEHENHK